MSIDVQYSPSGKMMKGLSKINYDVKFIFKKVYFDVLKIPGYNHDWWYVFHNKQEQLAERQEIEAHKFVLALVSDVFRAQFYGGLQTKPGEEIEIKDWSYYDFKIFVRSFYTKVNLKNFNIQTLCELYYLGDYYNVSEMKVCEC